jgi:hypothetical protein
MGGSAVNDVTLAMHRYLFAPFTVIVALALESGDVLNLLSEVPLL